MIDQKINYKLLLVGNCISKICPMFYYVSALARGAFPCIQNN